MKKPLRILAACTWELPQSIIAMIMLFMLSNAAAIRDDRHFSFSFTSKVFSSFSLGEFVFFNDRHMVSGEWKNIKGHEFGHSVQSRILGPMYLIVIGLPSLTWNCLSRYSEYCDRHYYDMPWEKWADKIGKIKRKKRT